jgi:hypothetical protein
MSSLLLKNLRIVHLVRRYIGCTSSRCALFLAILRRKLSEWWDQWPGKPGPSKPAASESSLPCTGHAGLCSAPGGPVVLRGYGVAASNVPASASQGSLGMHVGAEGQPATAPPSPTAAPISVEQSYGPDPGPSYPIRRSSSNVSIASTQSSSERLSRITASRKAQHSPDGQPAELPRSPHHQFGRGRDPSRSRGQLSRSPSPRRPLSMTQQLHHFDVTQTVVPTHPHADGRISTTDGPQSPADMPSLPYNTQEPQRTPLTRQKQKTSSLDVNVQSPSLESLAISTHSRPLIEGPMAISPTQPSIASSVTDHHETASQRPSFEASEYFLPEGRELHLINSEQIPRYSKNITMQVDCAISFIQS